MSARVCVCEIMPFRVIMLHPRAIITIIAIINY